MFFSKKTSFLNLRKKLVSAKLVSAKCSFRKTGHSFSKRPVILLKLAGPVTLLKLCPVILLKLFTWFRAPNRMTPNNREWTTPNLGVCRNSHTPTVAVYLRPSPIGETHQIFRRNRTNSFGQIIQIGQAQARNCTHCTLSTLWNDSSRLCTGR